MNLISILDAVIKTIDTCQKWDAVGRDKRPSEHWKVTEIKHGAVICLKLKRPSLRSRIYRKQKDTLCFTKKDLPPNAVFPGSPVAPSSNSKGGGSSEKGGDNLNRERRQSELNDLSRPYFNPLSTKQFEGL